MSFIVYVSSFNQNPVPLIDGWQLGCFGLETMI